MGFKAEGNKISIRGVIGSYEGGISDEEVLNALEEMDGDVTIVLNSEGGSVTDGIAIYNALMLYDRGKVTVEIDALAGSIASVVAMAGDHVVMNSNAKIMIHNAWVAAMGNAKDFRGIADVLDMMDRDIAMVYVERSGGDIDEFLAMMGKETWLSAEKSKNLGMIDEIREVSKDRTKTEEEPKAILALAPLALAATAKAKVMKLRINR